MHPVDKSIDSRAEKLLLPVTVGVDDVVRKVIESGNPSVFLLEFSHAAFVEFELAEANVSPGFIAVEKGCEFLGPLPASLAVRLAKHQNRRGGGEELAPILSIDYFQAAHG